MKKLILILILIKATSSHGREGISADELRPQVTLQVQTFVTDPSGKQIKYISPSQSNYSLQIKRGDISSIYSDDPKDFTPVRLDFSLIIGADKRMTLAITQYSSIKFDSRTGKTIKDGKVRSESFILSDFESISWVSESTSAGRVITRFVPQISDEEASRKLTYTPMSLVNVIISDNAGKVWAEGFSASGEVIMFQSHQGILYLSFTEFNGANEIGWIKGGLIQLNLSEKLTVRIRSEKSVLGERVSAKVYGVYIPPDKSSSKNASSVRAMSASGAMERINSNKNNFD